MKALPTLEGGLRIDTDQPGDWDVLRSIITDANSHKDDLANRLGAWIGEEAGSEDWQEYIVPDLREGFQDDLHLVGAAIEAAIFHAAGGYGSVWITPEDGFSWYSSLNQARLASEENFQFGAGEDMEKINRTVQGRAAYIRTRFYSVIQELLLEHVMR